MRLVSAGIDLESITHEDVLLDGDISSLTTFRLKSVGSVLKIKNIDQLKRLVNELNSKGKTFFIIGWGANLILPEKVDDVLIKLDFQTEVNNFSMNEDNYYFSASVGLNSLVALATKWNIEGWEVLTGIPASLGGAIFMNAGTSLGEISQIIYSVTYLDSKLQVVEKIITEGDFQYRKNNFISSREVILGARLKTKKSLKPIGEIITKYLHYRKETQPLSAKTCGCIFKNINRELGAGKFIDEIGLKGLQYGGVKVSHKHANFFENEKSSHWEQVENLTRLIKNIGQKYYGTELELEAIMI